MSQPRDDLAFIFECPYCEARHLYERYDHSYFYDDEIRWSDFSHYHSQEKISDCGSCAKAFFFLDRRPVRYADANVKRSYRPGEAKLLDCTRKHSFSKEETKFNGETIPYTITIRPASSVLESGNYPPEFESTLRHMFWWEYNALMKTHPVFSLIWLSWRKKIKKQVDLLSTKRVNAKRAKVLRKANKANLERLLELHTFDEYKLEIYRQLGMFEEAREMFKRVDNAMPNEDIDQFYWTFMRELEKRLKKRDKKLFGLKPTFKRVG